MTKLFYAILVHVFGCVPYCFQAVVFHVTLLTLFPHIVVELVPILTEGELSY